MENAPEYSINVTVFVIRPIGIASAQPKEHDPSAQPWLGPQKAVLRGGHKVFEVRIICQLLVLPVFGQLEKESLPLPL